MTNRLRGPVALFIALLAQGCNSTESSVVTPPPPPPVVPTLALRQIATGLETPVLVTAPLNDARTFIVEKRGRIRIFQNGQLLAAPFLDITALVSTGTEQGLLGVAFHPQYASNGIIAIDYTDVAGNTQIATYKVSGDPNIATPGSAKIVLSVAQPYANHNGGNVVFGPDGMLYVGMGDGGSGGDPQGHGQNANDLLGSLLRLQINGDGTMTIPADNPFVGQSGKRAELWDIGLRNPWRFSFDRSTGDLYIADVGQDVKEEVDVATASTGRGKGDNYGWNVTEGTSCYNATTCNSAGMVTPVLDYTHADGCAITGGFVYRGAAFPALQGTYFYSDYCNGWVRSFRYVSGAVTEKKEWPELKPGGSVTSYGEDAAGELYILTETTVWKVVAKPGAD